MTDAVHALGALAAVHLVHNGYHAPNMLSRAPALAPCDMAVNTHLPKQARAMDKDDIRALRQWHRAAALRTKEAGFDIIYVYAGHVMTLAQHFMQPNMNSRSDEYGGTLPNRARLTRELLEDTREAVGDSCAVVLRFAIDEMQEPDGTQAAEEGRAVVELDVDLRLNQTLRALDANGVVTACSYSGRQSAITCASAVLVTERRRNTMLFDELKGTGLNTLELIGDAAMPGLIADAVFDGHRAARDFERPNDLAEQDWFRREITELQEGAI